MTKGEGLVALLYALKDLMQAGVIWVITGFALLSFFTLIIGYIGGKMNASFIPKPLKEVTPNQIMMALFLMFIIFSIYSLIALTGQFFGVNSSPVGGIYQR